MKILFVTDFFYPHIGGVEKLFGTLTENLIQQGHEVTYITWCYNKELPKQENYNGITIIRIAAPSRLLWSIAALSTIIKETKNSDLIQTSTYSAAMGAWLAAKLNRKKIVVTVHEVWGKLWMKLPYLSFPVKISFRLFEKLMLSLRFDRYIAVSDCTRQSLINFGIPNEKIVRIYNGILYQVPQWVEPKGKFTFTFFGRGGTSKGLDLLMEAAEKICSESSDVHFKFIVSPQSKNIYKKIIRQINSGSLQNASTVLSDLSPNELQKELLSSNCIVIPSYSEGFGFTAAEASAMGIPIVSSGKGALPEVCSGKVVEMEHFSADGLLLALQKAIDNEFEYIPMKRFEIDDFVSNHLALYNELVK